MSGVTYKLTLPKPYITEYIRNSYDNQGTLAIERENEKSIVLRLDCRAIQSLAIDAALHAEDNHSISDPDTNHGTEMRISAQEVLEIVRRVM